MSKKVVLVGETRVGKSAIAARFGMGKFEENLTSTIGVSFISKTVQIGNNQVNFELWDTAGQERFNSITESYYREARVVLCVYDLSKKATVVPTLEIALAIKNKLDQNTIIAIVGNKSDISSTVPPEVESFSIQQNLQHYECSAKTGEGVNELFTHLAKMIISESNLDCDIKQRQLSRRETNNSSCC